ncbi:MAG: hypothetical protein J0H65_07645, partial [Rhizobiales bacterium]|nr:hypothetical protein [Hyphomicrobiales bacterium]
MNAKLADFSEAIAIIERTSTSTSENDLVRSPRANIGMTAQLPGPPPKNIHDLKNRIDEAILKATQSYDDAAKIS